MWERRLETEFLFVSGWPLIRERSSPVKQLEMNEGKDPGRGQKLQREHEVTVGFSLTFGSHGVSSGRMTDRRRGSSQAL